jgi:predicted CoA-substrate-specific enzyme activase
MICAGVDAGSRAIKLVLVETDDLRVIGSGMLDQGTEPDELASQLLDRVLDDAGLDCGDIDRTVATGYARGVIDRADATITEISCHACGVRHHLPDAMTVIEIGGQDSKVLRLGADGRVQDFVMNDRCAAGSGRFLEVVAGRLGVGLAGLGEMALRSRRPAAISSTCVVFAESEIIGLLSSGGAPEDIVAGVQAAIAIRVATMAGGQVKPPLVVTGGVALIPGMGAALSSALGQPATVASDPQFTGALGAAILAGRQC